MKFSFEEPHLWRQHALSLLSIGMYNYALSVLREVIRLEPTNSSNCLLAAKLCYEHLNLAEEGTNFSIEAKNKEMVTPSGLLGRCHLYIGIGYYLQSEGCQLKKEKEEFRLNALNNFQR